MNPKYLNLILFSFVLTSLTIKAQVSYGGKPYTLGSDARRVAYLPKEIIYEVMNTTKLLEKYANTGSENRATTKVLKYGEMFDVNIDFKAEANSYKIENGRTLYLLKIKSRGATTIEVYMKNFFLSKSAELYAYTLDPPSVLGKYDQRSNSSDVFVLEEFKDSDEIIIELSENSNDNSRFKITQVIHGFL